MTRIDDKPRKQELIVAITYYIGLIGCLISSCVVATVVIPDTHVDGNLWIQGLKALILFSAIWGGAIWYGLKNNIIEFRKSKP